MYQSRGVLGQTGQTLLRQSRHGWGSFPELTGCATVANWLGFHCSGSSRRSCCSQGTTSITQRFAGNRV